MRVWKVTNNSPQRQRQSYSPNRWEKKTQKYWSEVEAKKMYHALCNKFGEEHITLEYGEVTEWHEYEG